MRELNGNDVSFYRTSNPEVAAKLGVVLPTSSGTTSSGTTFGLAIRRKYPGHPETVIQYAGHKAEQLPASQEGDDATAADSEEAQILRKFKSFFYAEKLPDFVYYKDALLDGGNLVMSVPTEYHVSSIRRGRVSFCFFLSIRESVFFLHPSSLERLQTPSTFLLPFLFSTILLHI